ncbi:hypothetical protein VMCG_01968 [Cytospora schulzeri]|uniref:Uncharacterized protein n=1 Tax=Cytospora schulzeri TaxID=448051 RepID=A0A423X2V5_9PEZI|nr:hypothetical protein VMCG_01968 [Valsa malicola]
MDEYSHPKTLIQGWNNTPIPNFSLSASGLIILADLSTVAQRTALRGGSSWFDFLLLVPGLHYQQAANELHHGETAVLPAIEVGRDGTPVSHSIVNRAVVSYVLRSAREGRTVVLDVGELPVKTPGWRARGLWALGLLLALMASRILNIYVIKQRSRTPKPPPPPKTLPPPFSSHSHSHPNNNSSRITQYIIDIDPTTTVILRGLSTDLQALTTTVWLRPKTHVEGYLEATAKVLVYLVAACSGNATQAGNIILLVLVLVSAGLLALSNAQVKGLRNGGRVVAPSPPEDDKLTGGGGGGGAGGRCGRCSHGRVSGGGDLTTTMTTTTNGRRRRSVRRREGRETWPLGDNELSRLDGMEDSVEKGEAGDVFGGSYTTGDDPVDYRVQLDTRLGTLEVVATRDRDKRDRRM